MKDYNQAIVTLQNIQEYCKSDDGVGELEKLRTEAEIKLTQYKDQNIGQQGNLFQGIKDHLHSEKDVAGAKNSYEELVFQSNIEYIQKGEQILEKHDPSGYMDYHKDRLEERGYKCGHTLKGLEPEIAEKVYTTTGLAKENSFSIGMDLGGKQYDVDMLYDQQKIQNKEVVQEMSEPEKQLDKDDWRDLVDQERDASKDIEPQKETEKEPQPDKEVDEVDWRDMVDQERNSPESPEPDKDVGDDFDREKD